jgi:transposase
MKAVPKRAYTPEFRDAAVKQVVEGGRSIASVARSLEMSSKSLANWIYQARKGEALVKRAPAQPVSEMEAELSRLRQENAKLKLEKEILKKAAAYFAKESM